MCHKRSWFVLWLSIWLFPDDPDGLIKYSETYNLLFGRTVNPANRTLTSGGSSGGEGALLRMGGSILGVGSDVGG